MSINHVENEISELDAYTVRRILKIYIHQLQTVLYLWEDEADFGSVRKLWSFVIKSLQIACEELKSKRSFNLFAEIIDQERRKHPEDHGSIYNLTKCENYLSRLSNRISEAHAWFQSEVTWKNQIINQQIEELENIKVRNKFELKFEKKWLGVQIEENDLKCEMEEADILKQIENLTSDIQEEEKVHAELLWYYENEQEKINEQISYWKKRFKDIERRKSEIEILNKKQKTQYDELEYYKTMFNKRSKDMLEYEADKEQRRKEYEYEQYRHKMATKIQAWWRGVMVRRGLGPFKNLMKAKDLKKRKMSLKKNLKK